MVTDAAQPVRPAPPRLTVFFDADCGFCTRVVAWLRRVDRKASLAFVPSTDARVPVDVPRERLDATILVIDEATGARFDRARAFAAILRVLPGGVLYAWPLRLPGLRQIADWLYDAVAGRRIQISRAMGLDACASVRSESGAPPGP